MLDPAPAPEGHRGGAVAARRAHRRDARATLRGGPRWRRTAIGYAGAGTVEFLRRRERPVLLPGDEHPAAGRAPGHRGTTGLDLVALQLQIAEGGRSPPTPPPAAGHAIEVRLYAEDPAADWQPQTGPLHRFEMPGVRRVRHRRAWPVADQRRSAAGLRRDRRSVSRRPLRPDARQGHRLGADRDAGRRGARRQPGRGPGSTASSPTGTCWSACCGTRPSCAGQTDTAFLDRHGLSALAAPLAGPTGRPAVARSPPRWRTPPPASARQGAAADSRPAGATSRRSCSASGTLGRRRTRSATGSTATGLPLGSAWTASARLTLAPDRRRPGRGRRATRIPAASRRTARPSRACVDSDRGPVAAPRAGQPLPRPAPRRSAPGSLLAPMPGTVVRIAAAVGDRVTAGQPLLWLEAMKMEHADLRAGRRRRSPSCPSRAGQQVEVGAVLAVVKAEERAQCASRQHRELHRDRRAAARCATPSPTSARALRPRVLHAAGPRGGAADRAVARGRPSSASSASTCRRSTAAAAPACTSSRSCWRNSPRPAAGC